MKVKEIIKSNLYDENEQVVILHGDVNKPNRPYTGRMSSIPEKFYDKEVSLISSMGEFRRNKWNLNKYGWTEIWIEE